MAAEEVRPASRQIAHWVGAGLVAGFVSGLVIGGIGGRLAMFVLRVTSDPSLAGVKTDDGFVIGRFSASTGFLVMLCAFGGAAGGIGYVAVRWLLPDRHRMAAAALLAGVVGGSTVVHPDGKDFRVLSPLWLAIAMFVALPALYGAATSALAEKLGARTSSRVIPWLAPLALLALPPVVGAGSGAPLVVVGVVLLGAGAAAASILVPSVRRAFSTGAVLWAGRAALAAAGAWAGVLLVRDIVAILGLV